MIWQNGIQRTSHLATEPGARTPVTIGREDKTMTLNTGNFRLVLLVAGAEVPAHTGKITRDAARRLKKSYEVARPTVQARVRKVNA